ncbi:MAG: rod shape-determining protein MreC [Deltaproteobacteria bacterium]|nr:rod shape-determining protein MreC [Deltaproteobacteria bacterium]
MRGNFLWRHRVALTAGALLVFSAHLIWAGVPRAGFAAETALLDILRPAQLVLVRAAGAWHGLISRYLDLVGVARENRALRQRLAVLESEQVRAAELEAENRRLRRLLGLKQSLGYDAAVARVIGGDATGLARTLVLSQGAQDAMAVGMPVITREGVVGKLIAVGRHSSRMLLINDHNAALDAVDQVSRVRGIVAGDLQGGLQMKYVGVASAVKVGDPVVTSGKDGVFPRGLLVGRVAAVQSEPLGLFLRVRIAPAVDFVRLEEVLVIRRPDSGQAPAPGR